MRKLKTAAQYFIGGCTILFALLMAMINTGFFSVIIMILAGVILLPPVTRRIPHFRFRKTALIFLSLFLWTFSIVIADVPEVEHTDTAVPMAAVAESAPTDSMQEEKAAKEAAAASSKAAKEAAAASSKAAKEAAAASSKAAKEAAASKKAEEEAKAASEKQAAEDAAKIADLKELIETYYKSGDSISRKDKKAMTKANETLFYQAWRETAKKQIKNCQESKYSSSETDILQEYKKLVEFYQKIRPDASLITEETGIVNSIDSALNKLKKARTSRYGFKVEDASSLEERDFYVYERLKTHYDDTLLGSLNKQLDSLSTSKEAKWLAYNVDYIWGEAYPGDTAYVLITEDQNAFSESGAYNLNFVYAGKTIELVDNKGFRSDAPVYYIVDEETFNKEVDALYSAQDGCSSVYNKILKNLGL